MLVICSGREEVIITFSVFSLVGAWVFVFSVSTTIEVFSTSEGFVVWSIFSVVACEVVSAVLSSIWGFVGCSVLSLIRGILVVCSLLSTIEVLGDIYSVFSASGDEVFSV